MEMAMVTAMVAIATVDMEAAMVTAMVVIATVAMEAVMVIVMVAIVTEAMEAVMEDMEIAMVAMEEMVMEAAAMAPTINTFDTFYCLNYDFIIYEILNKINFIKK